MAEIAQDATDTTLDVVEEQPQEEARTYSASDVSKLKREAARLRRERNEHAEQLARVSREQEAARKKQAEEQGEYQQLYQTEQQAHAAYRSSVSSTILKMRLTEAAIARGVPPKQAQALAYPTDGLSLTDGFTVEGDLDAVLDPFIAPFVQNGDPAPPKRQPIAITERPADQRPESMVGAKALAAQYAKALKGVVR